MLGNLFCGKNKGNNEAVETQDLSENQDEDHAHKKPWLLSCASDTGVAHDADCEACCQPTQTHAQSSAEVEETPANTQTHSSVQTFPKKPKHNRPV